MYVPDGILYGSLLTTRQIKSKFDFQFIFESIRSTIDRRPKIRQPKSDDQL